MAHALRLRQTCPVFISSLTGHLFACTPGTRRKTRTVVTFPGEARDPWIEGPSDVRDRERLSPVDGRWRGPGTDVRTNAFSLPQPSERCHDLFGQMDDGVRAVRVRPRRYVPSRLCREPDRDRGRRRRDGERDHQHHRLIIRLGVANPASNFIPIFDMPCSGCPGRPSIPTKRPSGPASFGSGRTEATNSGTGDDVGIINQHLPIHR